MTENSFHTDPNLDADDDSLACETYPYAEGTPRDEVPVAGDPEPTVPTESTDDQYPEEPGQYEPAPDVPDIEPTDTVETDDDTVVLPDTGGPSPLLLGLVSLTVLVPVGLVARRLAG